MRVQMTADILNILPSYCDYSLVTQQGYASQCLYGNVFLFVLLMCTLIVSTHALKMMTSAAIHVYITLIFVDMCCGTC